MSEENGNIHPYHQGLHQDRADDEDEDDDHAWPCNVAVMPQQQQQQQQQQHPVDSDEEPLGGTVPLQYDRQSSGGTNDNNDSDQYFQDFDDTLSKDSVTGGTNVHNGKETDLIGVNIHLESGDVRGIINSNNNTPIVDVIPSSMSTNSLLGLTIPLMNQQKHRHLSSLQYSPSTLVTFVDGNGSALPVIPPEMLMEVDEEELLPRTREVGDPHHRDHHDDADDTLEDDATDEESILSNPPCYIINETPPGSSPNPPFQTLTQKRHHRRDSSLVSGPDSCLESKASTNSLESLNLLHYPNPDPLLFFHESTAATQSSLVGTAPPPFEGMSPLHASYSYEEDRSLCEEEKRFVQQIHNSGLSSLSFERVEDTLENTSMEVEMELVYNSGSFDNASVGGGASVESAEGSSSIMSVEERKEIERRIHCYRKFRQKQSNRGGEFLDVSGNSNGFGNESAAVNDAALVPPCIPVTPVAANKTSQPGFQMPADVDAIDEFNQELEDSLDSFEMIPLSDTANSSNTHDNISDSEGSGHLDMKRRAVYPNKNPGWRLYFDLRNFFWWWPVQMPSFSYVWIGNTKSNRTRSQSKYDYTHKEFDDVDFDRNSSYCYGCCRRCLCLGNARDRYSSLPYMQTGCGKLFLISCFCLLMGWIFSDGGLKKHRSQEVYADPLAPDVFVGTHRIIDDADDFDNNPISVPEDDVFDHTRIPVTRPEDDDIDFSFAQQYFPSESQSGTVVDDDVFRRFDMGDDVFDRSYGDGYYNHQELPVERVSNDDASILNDAAKSILSGFGEETGRQHPVQEIDTIVVLGERHVGIEWLVGKLKVLYPCLTVSSGFQSENRRDGMWFQPEADMESATTSKHILVIALFVNPYDWVELMRLDPINAPNHRGMEWKAFVEAEWSPKKSVYVSHDSVGINETSGVYPKTEPLNTIPGDDGGRVLDDTSSRKDKGSSRRTHGLSPEVDTNHTSSGDAVAITSKSVSFYENKMGGSGYYSSILELRADKIRAAVKGSLYRQDVHAAFPVRYEDLLQPYRDIEPGSTLEASNSSSHLPGIVGLIGRIQSLAGISPNAELNESFFPDPVGCNGHVCYPSIAKMRQNAEYIAYMNDHLDWHAEQLMGYQKVLSHPKPSVSRIVVLGERHSRAEWLVGRLSRCFPDIEVTYGFSRPGKFFQSPTANAPNTLVIATFINPYDWVEQMRQNPINAPAHVNMQWADFVTSPWERTRSHLDSIVLDTAVEKCSFGFSYHEIIPCHTQRDPNSADFPLYELRHPPAGGFDAMIDIAYSNLLDLRADKIQNFLSTAHYPGVVHLIKVRYEDLVWDSASYTDDASYLTLPFPGIAGLLESIRGHTTLTPDISAGWILDENGFFKAEPLSVGMDLDADYIKWMEMHVNWSVEALVGYGM
eukprot:CCRYP_017629-RA/>CCRYP_017629-RA protein AED:0.04 eAED:0.04 QI:1284/1/1/1/1/1/3/156/1395